MFNEGTAEECPGSAGGKTKRRAENDTQPEEAREGARADEFRGGEEKAEAEAGTGNVCGVCIALQRRLFVETRTETGEKPAEGQAGERAEERRGEWRAIG